MQLIAEGLAIAAFRFMQHESKDELLKEMLEYVIKDESRHVGFGVLALREGVRKLPPAEKRALEEFAFTACDMMVTKVEDGVPRDGFLSGMSVFDEVGISTSDLDDEMQRNPAWRDAEQDMERKPQLLSVRGYDHSESEEPRPAQRAHRAVVSPARGARNVRGLRLNSQITQAAGSNAARRFFHAVTFA